MSMASDCFSVLCVERGSMERFGFGSINSLESNSSLPSVSNHHTLSERRVAAWAVSFERLLQDPVGVRYFSVSRTRHELANIRHFVLCLPLSFLSKRYLCVLWKCCCLVVSFICLSLLPQEFLKKEFSEENILFWQACEFFSQVPEHDKKQVSYM